MRILILEDSSTKLEILTKHLTSNYPQIEITEVTTASDYLAALNREKFDLLIVDLVVPRFKDDEPSEVTQQIIEWTRLELKCPNFRTPGVAITGYAAKAEENFKDLNIADFSILTFDEAGTSWSVALDRKIKSLPASENFDFIIVCALPKEAAAFSSIGAELKEAELIFGLNCRQIKIKNHRGVIITTPRMGLVSCAITTSIAIHAFNPQLVCMSGICGGVPDSAHIYDVVIAETCHQHDAGKWAHDVFKPEIYSNSINHQLAQEFRQRIESASFTESIKQGIQLQANEFPDGVSTFSTRIFLAPASSGSAVIANEKVVEQIQGQQRKNTIFEMESYALYEAARLSVNSPVYFSAKAVVDDGGVNKGDRFHRVGCLLSAKVTLELIGCFNFS